MVKAARTGQVFTVAPRVEIKEVLEEEVVDKGEVVQAGTPFAVGGEPGGARRWCCPSPCGVIPRTRQHRLPFP